MLLPPFQSNKVEKFSHSLIIFGLSQLQQNIQTIILAHFSNSPKFGLQTLGKIILDKRKLFQKGLTWTLGNSKNTNIWYDIWMEDSLLINKLIVDEEACLNYNAKVSELVDCIMRWQQTTL